MIPVAKLFLVNEGFFDWMKNSWGSMGRGRLLNKTARPPMTAADRVSKVKSAQESIPKPAQTIPVKLGMEGIRQRQIFTK